MDDVKIIKHGKNPENVTLYCVCTFCGCEFSTAKKHFFPQYLGLQRDAVSKALYTRCPECESFCIGMTYGQYKQYVSIKKVDEGNG